MSALAAGQLGLFDRRASATLTLIPRRPDGAKCYSCGFRRAEFTVLGDGIHRPLCASEAALWRGTRGAP